MPLSLGPGTLDPFLIEKTEDSGGTKWTDRFIA